ncbi:putative immunity protein [Candidatus Methanomassiliicoccus intestinalis]|jgi:hypothetical protein|uniref:Imm-5-like domain-containing protein n=2 Tax=Candidatus Methanomassiliicoccus intestinalis TaxID=1406512 RepID=R9TAW2_METII|nr:hypothetical protein [Candidatus Methanomassiliicoccus intestinalis]AGN26548.1 hypothetical protein MMINT_12180 [Candidatus Methanomassiliicoccus intestinalis Issoire-Mx1]TQS83636.1 MAG: hypothetical protein A3207_08620 [Candidatus Methanomassiliicoccus intestinalis]TQS84192.1 MAG: hypothetical protein A3206_08435 [Candidatus Methanomassiliicoccus intestinalis]
MKAKFADSEKLFNSIEKLACKQDQKILAVWAADCAERVLKNFESVCPEDKRPRLAIEAARKWADGEIPMPEARSIAFDAHASARDLENMSAELAARSAGHSAATAHVAEHAVHASTYAVKSLYHSLKDNANDAVEEERKWQYQHLRELGANKS